MTNERKSQNRNKEIVELPQRKKFVCEESTTSVKKNRKEKQQKNQSSQNCVAVITQKVYLLLLFSRRTKTQNIRIHRQRSVKRGHLKGKHPLHNSCELLLLLLLVGVVVVAVAWVGAPDPFPCSEQYIFKQNPIGKQCEIQGRRLIKLFEHFGSLKEKAKVFLAFIASINPSPS